MSTLQSFLHVLPLIMISTICRGNSVISQIGFVTRMVRQCWQIDGPFSCLSEKAAGALERAMSQEISLLEGVSLVPTFTNSSSMSQFRQISYGFPHLLQNLVEFLDTHSVSVDLGSPRGKGGGGGFGGGHGGGLGGLGGGGKHHKKERRYMQYAFMVLLGIFGLTGPLVMKTLAVIAAKALIASKVALIIVGSVALKKIFEKDHDQKGSVKVHTITEDEHDRIYNKTPYAYYAPYESWSRPTK